MKRLLIEELIQLLACPDCQGTLKIGESGVMCFQCGHEFGLFRNRPALLSKQNELFAPSAYSDVGTVETRPETARQKVVKKIKRLIPKTSINLAREKMFNRLSLEHNGKGKIILIVGCGNQTRQLEQHFPDESTVFVFCDIDKNSDADVFCDSHELSFKNGVIDGVISTAVLEHVLYPEKVIAEISRVLKNDGFLYSEIPFLQSVHEGAYDFTRYTMSGHRRLLEFFTEIDSGLVAGPGTALVWSLVDFFRSLTLNQRVSSVLGLVARTAFFWLKYFDYLVKDNPIAMNGASCTYFYGSKAKGRTCASEIIDSYTGKKFEHI